MVKNKGTACNHRGHPGNSTEEKVDRNFPGPNRRIDHGLAVVAGLARNRATRNIETAPGDHTFFPRLPSQILQSPFGRQIGCHDKKSKARSAAMMEAV